MEVICGECPKAYEASDIGAYEDDEKVTTLAAVHDTRRPADEPAPRKSIWRTALGVPQHAKTSNAANGEIDLSRLRNYTFRCPKGHVVDGNSGEQIPLAILGHSGASKSHLLPAIVRELDNKRALSKFGVTLSDALYGDAKLGYEATQLYEHGRILDRTTAGHVLGPYGYKLTVRTAGDAARQRRYSLIMFDVSGESLQNAIKIADEARFIFLCRALFVLIDPVGLLPTRFDVSESLDERQRVNTASYVRRDIRTIADTIAHVRGVDSIKEVPIPVCFVLAKADAIAWPSGFDWETQLDMVISTMNGEGGFTASLHHSSEATRDAFMTLGGDLVVEEVEDLFNTEMIRYAPASATSTMPAENATGSNIQWEKYPEPTGIGLSLLHLLDLLGIVTEHSGTA